LANSNHTEYSLNLDIGLFYIYLSNHGMADMQFYLMKKEKGGNIMMLPPFVYLNR